MDGFVIYDFKIDAWRPETLPMRRLGEYAVELAKLFGSSANVHLLKVRAGSAVPEIAVACSVQPFVVNRLESIRRSEAADDVLRPYRKLNDYLREDGGSAVLKVKGGARVISFPGIKTPLSEEVVVHEWGTLDGVVIRVGGADETVPVWLDGEGGQRFKCNSSRAIAKELAAHLFGQAVRTSGNGKWRRNSERVWEMEEFMIKNWEPLTGESLAEAVAAMRTVDGSGWEHLDDPQSEWRRIRSDS